MNPERYLNILDDMKRY